MADAPLTRELIPHWSQHTPQNAVLEDEKSSFELLEQRPSLTGVCQDWSHDCGVQFELSFPGEQLAFQEDIQGQTAFRSTSYSFGLFYLHGVIGTSNRAQIFEGVYFFQKKSFKKEFNVIFRP